MAQNMSLSMLLDLASIQQIQDSFAKITGIGSILVDSEGKPLTQPSGFIDSPFPQENGNGKQPSLYRRLCQENRVSKKPTVTTSSYTGLSMGAIPIFLGTNHLGSWIVGPMVLDASNQDAMLRALREAEIGPAGTKLFLDQMPILVWKQLETVFEFLQGLIGAILQMARANADMERSYWELLTLNEKLDSTSQMMTTLANSADVGLFVMDYFTGKILQGNEQFSRYASKPLEELIGRGCWKWLDENSEGFCYDCPHGRLLDERGQPHIPLVTEKYIAATDTWLRIAHQAINWVDGRLAHMVTMLDITPTKKLQQQLSQYAFYDRNLHLPNGLRLTHDAKEWQDKTPVFLICFDINSLRTINDLYGRETGDALLEVVSTWVERLDIPGGVLYRIDGDQFAFAIPDVDATTAMELANVIYRRFEDSWSVSAGSSQKNSIYCGVSMGVVCANSGLTEGDDLLNIIERTLGRAMSEGKVVVYGEAMNYEYKEQLRLELSLEQCVKNGMEGFSVHYQPIVDAATGAWCSLEALCRWNSPEVGTISPLVFIHKAEQLGLITDIGNWVLQTAIRECKEMGLDKYGDFVLNVNLSPLQISDNQLESTVKTLLEQYNYPGSKLILEITETTEVSFSGQTISTMLQLRQSGILVALDDFGTGYSNFNNLSKLPVSVLKTERAFLHNIEADDYLQQLFHLMVDLAHAAGMLIIVEGVETEAQMQIMLKNGVDRMQGFYFGKPMSAQVVQENLGKFHQAALVPKNARFGSVKLDSLLRGYQGKPFPPQIYRQIGEAMHILLRNPNPLSGVEEMLAYVGGQMRMSRVWLYRRDGPMRTAKLIDWGVSEECRMPEALEDLISPYAWLDLFGQGSVITVTDGEDIPPVLRSDLFETGIKAVCVFKLCEKDEVLGYLGFDNRSYYREWSPMEMLFLHNIRQVVQRHLADNTLKK